MKNHAMRSNEQGVSESIGFMLIFTIVIAGIALVTLYGYPLLLQQQVGAEEKIMEKNMIVLQNDIKSLAYKSVPYKETSLKIGGGSLTVYDPSYSSPSSSVSINAVGNPPISSSGELRYESVSAQTDISLQNGAVVVRPRIQPGSAMLAEPRWYYDSNTKTVVINLINITSDAIIAKEGIGTVRMKQMEEPYYNYTTNVNSIDIVYTPNPALNGQDYSVAWDNYIKKTFTNPDLNLPPTTNTTGSGKPLAYTLTSNTGPLNLVIKKFEVKIESI